MTQDLTPDETQRVLEGLTRAKVTFQLRTIKTALQADDPGTCDWRDSLVSRPGVE